jgi:hypothetical protein
MKVGELDASHDQGVDLTVIGPSLHGITSNFGLNDSRGINIVLGALELTGPSFQTDVLPVTPPLLGELDPFDPSNPLFGTRAILAVSTPPKLWQVLFELTDLRAVPEPACLAHLAAVLAISGAFSCRRRR